MNKEFRDISTLKNWSRNPRSIKDKDYERLIKHITDFGQMQPLVITPDGEVLGGNMRLRVYKELGIKDIWVEIIKPKNEENKIRIALALNDRAGFYDSELLANLTGEYQEIDWENYAVDMTEPRNLANLIPELEKEKEKKKNKCPKCGYEW